MAYKFQIGDARLSGSLVQEGNIEIADGGTLGTDSDADMMTLTNGSDIAIASDLDFNIAKAGGLQLAGTAVTATAAEINYLDNDDLVSADIQKLADLTATAAEINYLDNDDLTAADITKLAAIDATAAEIDHLDGIGDAAYDETADSVVFFDATDSKLKYDAANDFAGRLAGDGLTNTSGQLVIQVSGAVKLASDKVGLSGSIAGDALDFAGGADSISAIHVVADESTINSAGLAALKVADNGITATQLNSSVAGDGLAGGNGTALSVNVDDTGIEINSDTLRLKDLGVSTAKIADDAVTPAKMSLFDDSLAATDTHILIADGTDYSSFAMSGDATLSNAGVLTIAANAVEDSMLNDNVATGLAGDGLSAASGVMAVAVSGAVHVASDKVSISGSIAGDALDFAGGVDSISAIHVVADESTIEAVGRADLRVKAAGITESHLNSSVAGLGISGGAGTALALDFSELADEAIASGDRIAFRDADDDGMHAETVDDLAALFAGNGLSAASAVMALDLNELSAATVDVAADSIAIIDGDDSNGSKKESIADLVSAMAGAGLSAASGVLSVTGNNVASKADGDTLAEGYNYFADLSGDAAVTMPASPSVGDVVTVKAGNLTGAAITINRAGSHTIDGETSILIESPYGAVTMVYVAANDWRIV